MPHWTFYIETFGCKINQYESQLIRESWRGKGGEETDAPENARFILVNSCAITAQGERDARNAVYRLKQLNPHGKIILTGCAAQFFDSFQPLKNGKFEKPDLIVPQSEKSALLAGPEDFSPANCAPAITGMLATYNRSRAVVKIQDGCSQYCAYCVVPFSRGKPRSRPREAIFAECENLLAAGHAELVLSGINLRQYGINMPQKYDFWNLLEDLIQELGKYYDQGSYRLRVSSIDPAMLGERSLAILAKYPEICPHLHLSLQHASPDVLRRMGRSHYNPQNILEQLENLKKFWPLAGLGADILVGFPGETEEDLRMLENFARQASFSYAHVFPFSPRPGAKAAQMPGQIPHAVKKERAAAVRKIIAKTRAEFMQQQAKLPVCHVILDRHGKKGHAVNEYYCDCLVLDAPSQSTGIHKAAPLGLEKGRLKVRLIN